MHPSETIVHLSRLQFAFTAMFHFLFVPLTLGLTWILFVMETLYVRTGKTVYRDMTQFWGKLLAINFALGIVTGITMEFEFGQNWAYFSRMIGGSFAPILAIEGITAFMLEATMFGLFFFGWNKLSKAAHLTVTFLMSFGASLSIVNILAANSWMQDPKFATFDVSSMTMNIDSILGLYINALAQVRIGHVANAGFVTGAIFVMGISAYYLLKGRDIDFAKRSIAVAASFGIICSLSVAFYGDANGLVVSADEPEKMAAIEAQWETQKAPAAWSIIAFPNQKEEKNYFPIKVPYALSLIATHSLTGVVPGELEIMQGYKPQVANGVLAYNALKNIRQGIDVQTNQDIFNKYHEDIGFGFLAASIDPTATTASTELINATVKAAIPNVATAFWTFRFMLGFWGLMLLLFILGLTYSLKDTLTKHRLFLRCALYGIPLPFLAAECGWVLAENGRQPWIIHKVLPTSFGVSSVDISSISASLIGFIIFYIVLFILEFSLMKKYAKQGPSSLGLNKYHFEQQP